MKIIRTRFAFLLLLIVAVPISQTWAASSEKGVLVASLVRSIGYGAGIHNYRNFVLRGTEKYQQRAEKNFNAALETLAALRTTDGLTAEEQKALDDIESVIQAYLAKLPEVQDIYGREQSLARILSQVDEQARIDDAPAVAGIGLLWQTSGPWSPVEEIEFAMGFGGGIDNFKNYVIRQNDEYLEKADASFSTAEAQAEKLRASESLNGEQRDALKAVEKTIRAYHGALPRVTKTIAKAKGSKSDVVVNLAIRGADRTVKINDGPAVAGLAVLRAD